ncbi:hypothetical protein L486_08357 [Kwoniella mangroviensis CBS 10435]|uniref:Chromo domain-containing protein n=1 Tax=Kwoniella mangroviensis CBS 10435 TaxID=1331196 RepID=A0A1B9IFR7_9TREE|nr:hypothetical protein L486_08357 [Kwoniella mangroviensis CBS 10435]
MCETYSIQPLTTANNAPYLLTPKSAVDVYPQPSSSSVDVSDSNPITPTTVCSKSKSTLRRTSKVDDQKMTHTMGTIAELLTQQSQLISDHENRLRMCENYFQNRFEELESTLETLIDSQRADGLELEVYIKDKVDDMAEKLDKLIEKKAVSAKGRPSRAKVNQRNGNVETQVVSDTTRFSLGNILGIEDLITFDTPSSLDLQDTQTQLQTLNFSHDLLDPLSFDSTIFDIPQCIGPEKEKGSSFLAGTGGTLVDQAIEKQRNLLNGESVLKEGESSVGFAFRKKLKGTKRRDNFKIDMSFLDEISIDARSQAQDQDQERSESEFLLPTSYGNANQQIDFGPSNYVRSNEIEEYNPFPLTYLRAHTSSSIPHSASSSSDTSNYSDDSHLTSIKRGASLVDDKLLLPGTPTLSPVGLPTRARTLSGNGKKREKVSNGWAKKKKSKTNGGDDEKKKKVDGWPTFGINTLKNRMDEIVCDTCGGRVHWACAGLSHSKNMREAPWSCPDCLKIMIEANDSRDGRIPSIPRAQQEKCLRPNCIFRSERRIVRENDDVNQFFMEKIIGRKKTSHRPGSGNYLYLVKWWDWEIYDSTWEPGRNIPDLERYEALFLQYALKTEGTDMYLKNVLLLEECSPWFDHKGRYNVGLLKSLGVEKRLWWDDD